MMTTGAPFDVCFRELTGWKPLGWQQRLFNRHLLLGDLPAALDVPTGLGKTSVIALWLIARAHGAGLPRRLVYVVDRRAVVDQATAEAEKLREALEADAKYLKAPLGLGARKLPISTLRGAHIDNREWLDDPAAPAIIVGTVDMIGSRLLFEGYGVSRKMRPYQAGLLGVDALIVLDEAHLVPPFAQLLREVEQNAALRAKDEAYRKILPRFAFLPLSATQRDASKDAGEHAPFRLEEEDWKADHVAKMRLEAKKRVRFRPLAERDHDTQFAEAAWELATKDGKFFRVAVFCDRRDKKDTGGGPSAQGVAEAIRDFANGEKNTGPAKTEIHPVELLVGARRVHERDKVEQSLRHLGFIGQKGRLEMPAFLVATAAGEVGVDIDSDHMVSDLVAWERMVQRLGRVNRRGEGDAEIRVFWSEPSVKDANAPTESEKRALIAFASKAVVESLPQMDDARDASPGALGRLAERARSDRLVKALIGGATTPEPRRPALDRALVDAWSMTSLETHTGRPDISPWLRGWVEEEPQTTIVWRRHLPVRVDARGRTLVPGKAEIEDFFEAAPPHESEKLETETYRVAAWLQSRAKMLLGRKRHARHEYEVEVSSADNVDTERSQSEQGAEQGDLRRDDVVVLILSSSGVYTGYHTLNDAATERKGDAKGKFQDALVGKILVVDAYFGGLKDGLLDPSCDAFVEAADSSDRWSKEAGFRVRRFKTSPEGEPLPDVQDDNWRFEDDFDLRRDGDGAPLERLVVEHFKEGAHKEDARSVSKPQELTAHQEWARSEMVRLAKAVNLSDVAVAALTVAASLHDEGKRSPRWQRAFKAPREKDEHGAYKVFAKTRGPIDQAVLGGYRHEFGSLPAVEGNAEFKALPADWRDLVLHLVAAHHGQGRPEIETSGCEDGPPSLLEERARAITLRFARLQKCWGPWGLSWWEALMRAADQQASRDNEDGKTPSARDRLR
jgi:CRISPR-associated endonuclease/helicase Cas3